MSDVLNIVVLFLKSAVIAGTPLLFSIIGTMYNEKAGNTNLVEGMMLQVQWQVFIRLPVPEPSGALPGACVFGALGALIYAFLTVTLRSNQVVTGLALTIFGTGCPVFKEA